MDFFADKDGLIEDRLITYCLDEFSFDTSPTQSLIDFDLIINTLNLTVIDDKIIQIWGFLGNARNQKIDLKIPSYFKGALRIGHSLKPGFSYNIYEEDQPVFFDEKTGWICIGDKTAIGEAVEFINNCVAVVNDKRLMSLWLRPQWD